MTKVEYHKIQDRITKAKILMWELPEDAPGYEHIEAARKALLLATEEFLAFYHKQPKRGR